MKDNENEIEIDEETRLKERKKERARQYFIQVADLSLLIVKKLREHPDGLTMDMIAEILSGHNSQLYTDAIESAIEDEYVERIKRDDGQEYYCAIVYDEYD